MTNFFVLSLIVDTQLRYRNVSRLETQRHKETSFDEFSRVLNSEHPSESLRHKLMSEGFCNGGRFMECSAGVKAL